MLVVDGEDALWVETDEWKYRDPNDTDTNNAPTVRDSPCDAFHLAQVEFVL